MNPTLKFFIITIPIVSALTWTGSLPVHARSPQSLLDIVTEVESPTGLTTRSFYTSGPAIMAYKDSMSLSGGSVTFDHSSQSRPTMVQTGSGHTNYKLGVSSYYKLKVNSTVWGVADYTKRTINDISFADCLDYTLVAPYCMGDDTGENISAQRYRFGGGWNGIFGQWSFGLGARYRAEIGHRSRDPRVRDIVSDLDIDIGAARRVSTSHILSINLGMKIYHQDCDVKFMNEANTITTLVYSGMGQFLNRFTGNTVSATAYSATSYRIGFDYIPIRHTNGFYGHAEALDITCDMFLREHNNAKAGYTSTSQANATLAWKQSLDNGMIFFPNLKASFFQRNGTENLFGSGTGLYDIIGSRKIYKHTMMSATLNMPVEWNLKGEKLRLTATPAVGWNSYDEQLLDPVRKIKFDHLNIGLSLDALKQFNKSFVKISLSGLYSDTSAATPDWGSLDLTSPTGAALKSNYDMLSCNMMRLGASATYGILINNLVYELNIGYGHIDYRSTAHSNALTASLSLKF